MTTYPYENILLQNTQTRNLLNKVWLLKPSIAKRILKLNNTKTIIDIIGNTYIASVRTQKPVTGFMFL